ncbi:hypothetical protein SCLARK_001723 [Spiroplasma clarkii]|uniref:hypothetical protein n=1 Tax=Spiroplasma clarkii TaxID=2139 RepID=UPI000B565C9C|nr:hypothetical protein [Spiroplasma clarkii]ARU92181.1 hypothetical protein SCLARK_001723 [Spiroplasma clarkii]
MDTNSLIYIDSDNKISAYALVNREIESANIQVPLVYAYKFRDKINLQQLFSNNVGRIKLVLESKLVEKNSQVVHEFLAYLGELVY